MIYTGIVEDRTSDPLKLGRCKVRVFGKHSPNKSDLPTHDLPWAMVMQPVTSAANSGIGESPTGLVEGTMVVVIYNDEHQQQPIIIGTLAGIPSGIKESVSVQTPENAVLSGTGSTVVDGNGNPVTFGQVQTQASLKVSQACYESVFREESLSSLEKGKNKYVSANAASKLNPDTILYSYKDSGNKWTIGYGSTYLEDNSPVDENTSLTLARAQELAISKIDNEFSKSIRNALNAPVTQSMFDALVAISYNTGAGALIRSPIIASINATNYEEASSLITQFRITANGIQNTGISNRRLREKSLFDRDGFPNKDLSNVKSNPSSNVETSDATTNPVVTLKKTKKKILNNETGQGFKDPNGVYPTVVNEPDTHRLSRHENVDQTIVYLKEQARVEEVPIGDTAWSQPKIPYNALYPFNHVKVSESGHVHEVDDTPGNERIHTYHRSGTYEEIDRNGSRVNRIVGDDFEILERNGHVLVKGSVSVTILGDSKVRIENNSVIDVFGNVNMTVGGNMNAGVSGDYKVHCGGNFSIDAANVFLNSGVSDNPLGKGTAQGLSEFPELSLPNRMDEVVSQYETPEDGDATEYKSKLDLLGLPSSNSGESLESTNQTTRSPDKLNIDNSDIPKSGIVDRGFMLSENFSLKQLDPKGVYTSPAIGITPYEVLVNLRALCQNCLEYVKELYPSMQITSGFRNYIPHGGSKTSDHLSGSAVDIVINSFDREGHYNAIKTLAQKLPAYTQLILEYSGKSTVWIHISFSEKRGLKMENFTMNNHSTYPEPGAKQYVLLA